MRNPDLYMGGPKNVHMNGFRFLNWVFYTLVQSLMVFFFCFAALENAPASINGENGIDGKLPDMWLLGMLLYIVVVILVNN